MLTASGSVKNHRHRVHRTVSRLLQMATVASWIRFFQPADLAVCFIACRAAPTDIDAHVDHSVPVDDGFPMIGDPPTQMVLRASVDVLEELSPRSRGMRPVLAIAAAPSPRWVDRVSMMVRTALRPVPGAHGVGPSASCSVTDQFVTAHDFAEATQSPQYGLFSSPTRDASGTY